MKNKAALVVIGLVQTVIGIEWIRGGWEKVDNPNFVAGMGKTLGLFASKNPTPWYKDFLKTFAIPNSTTFGWLVAYGELLAGIALVLVAAGYVYGAIYGGKDPISRYVVPIVGVGALAGGALMSFNFWFAAGWLSVSTDGVNLVMGLTEIVLIVATLYFLFEKETVVEATEVPWDKLFAPAPAPKEPVKVG